MQLEGEEVTKDVEEEEEEEKKVEEGEEVTKKVKVSEPRVQITVPTAKWGSTAEFVIALISFSLGMANITNFPDLQHDNGGTAFIVAYLIIVSVVGRPLYYFELALGQFVGRPSIQIYTTIAIAWKGIGIVQVLICTLASSQYSSVIGLYLRYAFSSYYLSWQKCDPSWEGCFELKPGTLNGTDYTKSSTVMYMQNRILKVHPLDGGIAVPNLELCLCNLLIWLAVFLIHIDGIRTVGKANFLLGGVPFLIMILLSIEGAKLKGATYGMSYSIYPNWRNLLYYNCWQRAATQMFFSLGIGVGTIPEIATHNGIHADIGTAALMACICDTFAGILSSIAMISFVGALSDKMKVDIPYFMKQTGTAKTLTTYLDALTAYPKYNNIPPTAFCIMVVMMGLGSLSFTVQVVTSNFEAYVPMLKSWQISAIVSTIGFILSIPYTLPIGSELVSYFGTFAWDHASIISIGAELLAVAIYGLQNWIWDVEFMKGDKLEVLWPWCWFTFIPLVLLSLAVAEVTDEFRRENIYYSVSGYVVMWLVISPIPICLIFYYMKFKKSKKEIKLIFSGFHMLPASTQDTDDLEMFRMEAMARYKYSEKGPFVKFWQALLNKSGIRITRKVSSILFR